MIVVAIIGILASAAIPSFLQYIRRSQTVEATMCLRRMYDGAVAYYATDRSDSNNNLIPRMFPSNAGPTPASIPAAQKIKVPVSEWNTPEWQALSFFVTDAQRYSYSFLSSGADSTAKATLLAQGDLNGDGIPSSFSRTIQGGGDGVQSSGGASIIIVSELE